ncbi:MAG: hypothetical protein KBT11_09725 [Treponema sp.]|nr:hypothetical protein [Candidatus Treponema equifaecale]
MNLKIPIKTRADKPSSGNQKVLSVVYDLKDGLPSDFPTADTVVSADWAVPTATPATNDVTFTWVPTTNRKFKNNGGCQVSNGTGPEEAIKISAPENIKVTVTYKFAGAYAADKIRELDVGDAESKMASDTNKDSEYTLTNTTAAKEVSIKVNGVKLLKIETAKAN